MRTFAGNGVVQRSLSVRQKVRQFAVDTDLSVSLRFTCQPLVILVFGQKPRCNLL